MKKLILLSGLFLVTSAYSQEHKWFVGGGANANISSNNNSPGVVWQAQWTLTPEIGTYITPNIQVGGNLDLGENVTRSGGTSSRVPRLGAGIFGRYLFGETNFHPFVGIKTGYTLNGPSWSQLSQGTSYNYALINGGVLYNINSRFTCFASVAAFGYTGSRIYSNTGADYVSRSLGFNLNSVGDRFAIGLYYNFGKALD